MTPDHFTHTALPIHVLFGRGRVTELADEAARLELRRVLVLSTPGQQGLAERAATALEDRCAGIFPGARMHVPLETAEQARAEMRRACADGCVAIGGGSAIGLGKAIALHTRLPVIAVPTTYAGSEMTSIWGITKNDRKRTGRDTAVLPRSVVYDPELTLALPATVSGTSGLNALAHAVEALYAPDTSPVIALLAEDAVRALATALPELATDPGNIPAREKALRGAWLCGMCLGSTTMSLHHKLCHVLGGTYDLPHAPTHAAVLPHVAGFNLASAPEATAVLRRALDTDDPASALARLRGRVGAPQSLRELGLSEQDLPTVVEEIVSQPYHNPRPVTADVVLQLLKDALDGTVH